MKVFVSQEVQQPAFFTRERIAVYSSALLVAQIVVIGVWVTSCWLLHNRNVPPPGLDFRVFWSASFISIHQGAIAAFNSDLLLAIENTLLQGTGIESACAPWIYPPPFQLLIFPLAILPYPASYALFCCISIACCLLACAPLMKSRPLPWAVFIAFPGIWVAIIHGQNSLITLALAAGALGLLEKRPVAAGVCAGLLVIKPQLAPVFPLLFLFGRNFKALVAAGVTAALLCLVSGLIFGAPLWLRFFEMASWFNSAVQNNYARLWDAMPTVFAIARHSGASIGVAYALHAFVALGSLLFTISIWLRKPHSSLANAAAVTTALLVPTYLLYYDLAWLLLPILYLAADFRTSPRTARAEYVVVTLAWLAPLASLITWFMPFKSRWAAVVLIALMVIIVHRFLREIRVQSITGPASPASGHDTELQRRSASCRRHCVDDLDADLFRP
ncbi:glycosyltransferase family 87 protein [Paraburkholderia silviterrae]|uniref:glycosyltransferase family 87 protein n=1 Tax=Paraburkholderia silviterrae TaxID=2528715 RepID=UPI001F0E315D|nr:glycosyltransferase family 87 protein [Paraburkholderia silviterrae]